MKITVLGSGSKGNAAVVGSNGYNVLIDAGFYFRQLSKRMEAAGISPESLNAVFLTHEHSDHIIGLDVMMRRLRIPLYTNKGTYSRLYPKIKNTVSEYTKFTEHYDEIEIGRLKIKNFPISHDAADPVGFVITEGKSKLGYVTDIGRATTPVIKELKDAHALVVESNHDTDMLWNGGYPEVLKQRIAGPKGHLSNDNTLKMLRKIVSADTKVVCLAHLSQENNDPNVALETVSEILNDGIAQPEIFTAQQDVPSETIVV